ncbi:hypothetical protein M9H77_04744 [Catharanthus roseus]|uniref:Uncharacterized protein n=1 Tax=Catharanthus roseus TaxID=4058 RepID=A0ACC0CFI6_CATRO|nr:hypothetical protein M9H77_04744 [Catharanthus roseus]
MDKSYWEHVSIAHRKIQKSSDSSLDSGSRSGSSFCERGRLPRALRGRDRGRSIRRNSLSSVIALSPCSTFPYIDAFPSFVYPFIENWKNVNVDRNCGYWVVADFVFGDEHQWHELSDTWQNNNILLSYKYEMDAHCPLDTCNGNITVVIESVVGQRLILTGLQIRTQVAIFDKV